MPPGAAIAVLAGGVFAVAAAARSVALRRSMVLAAATLLIAGCGSGTTTPHASLTVVATTTQIGDWVGEIGGSAVDVHQILQPNTDPHEYEPRPNDVIATAGARIVFENGDNLDRWMGKVISNAGGHPTVIDLGASVPVKRPGERSGPRGLALRPALVARPGQRRGRSPRDPSRAQRSRPGSRRPLPAERERLSGEARSP